MDTLVHIQSHIVKEWFPGCPITSENVFFNFKVKFQHFQNGDGPSGRWNTFYKRHIVCQLFMPIEPQMTSIFGWVNHPKTNKAFSFQPKQVGPPFGYPRNFRTSLARGTQVAKRPKKLCCFYTICILAARHIKFWWSKVSNEKRTT